MDSLGYAYANYGLPAPFLGGPVSNTYTAAGAIANTDRLATVNSGTAVSLTLAAGQLDGHPLIVKNPGAGTATLTLTLDGTAGATATLTQLQAVRLLWSATLATWMQV